MPESYDVKNYDVLVIGAGGAGLRAAIAAAETGAKVAVISKSLLGKAHTVMAEGGAAAALGNVDPEDSWKTHFYDTVRSAKFINNWRIAEIFTKEAPDRIIELESWGALFDRTPEGRINQRWFGAHTYKRLAMVGDRTGLEILRTLEYKALHSGIDFFVEFTSVDFVRAGDRISGVVGYYRNTGAFAVFKAKAVVLASGGWGKVYKATSNSWESTGEGAAMAYRAGAKLMDMEMVQFHPTGMVWPPGVRGLLVTESVRADGGYLLNSEGERFMLRYDPERKELSSRDVVARSIYKEVKAGRGSPHGGAFLDITHMGADYIKRRIPNMYDQYKTLADIDITKDKFEVGPTIHYTMGGIRFEPETCRTNLAGLYVAGESASGLHGANRLGGNSLTDLLVFGRRAGLAAGEEAKGVEGEVKIDESEVQAAIERTLAPLGRDGENPYEIHEALQEVMGSCAGIERNGEGLETGLKRIKDLQDRAKHVAAPGGREFNPGWHAVGEVNAMLVLSEAIFRSAIERKESRGAHWRTDYPEYDDELGQLNFITEIGKDGEMTLSTEPVPKLPAEYLALFDPKRDPGMPYTSVEGTSKGGGE